MSHPDSIAPQGGRAQCQGTAYCSVHAKVASIPDTVQYSYDVLAQSLSLQNCRTGLSSNERVPFRPHALPGCLHEYEISGSE
jgi:hypothetical protein